MKVFLIVINTIFKSVIAVTVTITYKLKHIMYILFFYYLFKGCTQYIKKRTTLRVNGGHEGLKPSYKNESNQFLRIGLK